VGAHAGREQFLQEKIDHEAATVAKLINLPHQHVLLVLRVCVQQNLRHLQRSLKSDDLVHLWDKLDTTLREALRNPCVRQIQQLLSAYVAKSLMFFL
jgi:hypothetical protein